MAGLVPEPTIVHKGTVHGMCVAHGVVKCYGVGASAATRHWLWDGEDWYHTQAHNM